MKPFFVFSGQGAQSVGMGRDLAEKCPAAARVFEEADRILGFELSRIIFEGPEEDLLRTCYCQSAIYTMSCAALAAFRENFPQIIPASCAGLSLGEYGALFCAGAFDFETGLKLLAARSSFMEKACQASCGGMASVIKGDPAVIREVCEACGIDVANYNSPAQIVISGEKEKVDAAVAMLGERGIRKVIPLNVAGAFHSRLMKTAGEELVPVLASAAIRMPSIPVYHNFTAATAASVEEIRRNLAGQVAGSVRWEECVQEMVRSGDTMIEFGPGNVLTKLCSRMLPEIKTFNINSWETLSNFIAE